MSRMLPNTMKALVFELNISKYLATNALNKIFPHRFFAKASCLRLKEVPIPNLPSEDWVMIKSEACGICGSDIAALIGRDSFSMEPYSSFPAVLGHEAIGHIVKTGKKVEGFKEGDRVAVDSILSCAARDMQPFCRFCKNGEYSLCENFTSGSLSAGPVNGFNRSVGGGFAEYLIAHRSQLFSLPRQLPTLHAVLIDPLASSLQPVTTHFPKNSDTVLIYGAGIIGILTIKILRVLGSRAKIIAIARHKFQATQAKNSGADEVIEHNLFEEFTKITGSKMLRPKIGKPVFEGGVDIVFDCVGSSESIDNSLRFLKKKGKLVIVGTAGRVDFDASPIWFREISVTGSAMYSNINIHGKQVRTYRAAIDLVTRHKINLNGLVTHAFRIDNYEKAINTALNKEKNRSIKVAFTSV